MRSFAIILLTLFAAAGGWFAHEFLERGEHEEKPAHEEKAGEKAHEEEPAKPGVVKLDEETQHRFGVEVAELAEAELPPRLAVTGRVLDPAPLIALDSELTTAVAALDVSKAAAERSRNLFQSGESVARKSVETAEAQLRSDEIKVQGLRRRMTIEWGEWLLGLDAANLQSFIDELVRGKAALVRLDLFADEAPAAEPIGAEISVLGNEKQSVRSGQIFTTMLVDARTQNHSYVVRCEVAEVPLRPGSAVNGWVLLPGEPTHGVVIPREALIRHDAQTWVYAKAEEEGEFERRVVKLDKPLANGWFVGEGWKPEDAVVTSGAQSLLSAELAALGGGGEED
ncbi:efflux RND transporter periplasmic adaptor subunit [Verrucomicrobiota bacterium sgz303538]